MAASQKIAGLIVMLGLASAALGQQQNAPVAPSSQSSAQSSSKQGNTTNNGAQQPLDIKPVQPEQPLYGDPNAPEQDTTVPVVSPIDRRPLSGIRSVDVEAPSGGGGLDRRGQLTSSFSFAETITNNPEPAGIDGTYWRGQSSLAGTVRYSHSFGMNGGLIYQGTARWDSQLQDPLQFHQISYNERFHVGRLSLGVSDSFGYSQDSGFGFGGLQGLNGAGFNPLIGSLGQFGLLPSGLNQSLLPSDNILTQNAGRITNTVGVESDYALTPRTSATFNGSYGLFHGLDVGLIDSGQYTVGGGINHMLSARVSVSAQYSYGAFSFGGFQRDINNHTIGGSAAYRVNGRLSLHATGYAQISSVTDPTTASSSVYGGGSAGASYYIRSTSLALNYFRGITSGSGVLPGATSNFVTLAVSRSYKGRWNYGLAGGYSHNTSLGSLLTFENEYAGVSVSHPLTRTVSLYANYAMQHQKGTTFCSIALCDNGSLEHVFGLGLTFNPKPIKVF